jgi:hypothetical protein
MLLPILFSSASLILWGISFVFFYSYLRRRTGPRRILGEFREEADKLIAEIDAITDRDAALVGERIKNLRSLLEDADRRIAVYTKVLDKGKKEEAVYVELGQKRSLLSAREERPPEKTGDQAASNPPPLRAVPEGEGEIPKEPERPPAPPEAPLPTFAEQVENLAAAGLAPELIASRLGATLAEVDLAIALLHRA